MFLLDDVITVIQLLFHSCTSVPGYLRVDTPL